MISHTTKNIDYDESRPETVINFNQKLLREQKVQFSGAPKQRK